VSESSDGGARDTATLLKELGTETAELVTKEMALARAELRQELSKGVRATASLSAAAIVALLALVFLSSAAAWGLAEVLPAGVAFLIVGAGQLVIAAVLAVVGRQRLARVDPVPHQTVESLKEDARWATNRKS
jgi:uncharacterized membrane protein YqjE